MLSRRVGSIAAIIFLATFTTTIQAQDAQADREAARKHRLEVLNASKEPDGLHKAAKLNGGSYRTGRSWYGFGRITTLEALAEQCDAAIIATALSSEVKLVNQGTTIVTDYKLKVQEPIQGKVRWDQVLEVSLLGGKVTFEDGTTAELEVGDLPRLQIGHRYVIYLEINPQRDVFLPLGGPEGIFELGEDGKVSPFATPENTEAAAKGDEVLEFINKVRFASRLQKAQ